MSDTAVIDRPRRRWLGTAVALVVGLLLGSWAGATLLAPPADVLAEPEYVLVEAVEGSVGQVLNLNAAASWSASSSVASNLNGTVTSTPWVAGQLAKPGDVLYAVNARPVVVAAGAVPAYRDLTVGATGEDVGQLQRLLTELGHYSGAIDNQLRADTLSALRQWRTSLGFQGDDALSVPRGELLFLPDLPQRLSLGPDVKVGAELSGAHVAAQLLGDAPAFSIALTQTQAGLIQQGAPVEVAGPSGPWAAQVARIEPGGEETGPRAHLAGVDGASICGESCAEIAVAEPVLLPATIELVPPTQGVIVPTVALVTTAEGAVGVRLGDGTFRDVAVVASAQGNSVVTGISAGDQIRAPGETP